MKITTKQIGILNTFLFIILVAVSQTGFNLVVFNEWLTLEKGLFFAFAVLLVGCVVFLFSNDNK